MRLALLIVAFLIFTSWSLWSIADEGVAGLVSLLQREDWGRQVFVDLAISLVVGWSFMAPDAKARRLPWVPYLIGSVAVGSIAVLAYLIHRELRGEVGDAAQSA